MGNRSRGSYTPSCKSEELAPPEGPGLRGVHLGDDKSASMKVVLRHTHKGPLMICSVWRATALSCYRLV